MRPYLSVLIYLLVFLLAAQTKTFVGVKIGGGASTVYMRHSVFTLINDVNWLPGINGGIQVTHFSGKYNSKINSGIQFGLNYVQKGWVQVFKDTSEPKHKTRINYLELPIEAVGYFGNKTKYYVSAGFFVEYAIASKVDATPATAVESTDSEMLTVGQSHFYKYRLNKDNRLNYGPRGSVGVFRETDIGIFRLEIFFSFSVRSVFDYGTIESQIPDLSLNYGAGVSISYLFSFGKLEI